MTPYLYAHPNRHAPRRSNGISFWGYPTRSSRVQLIALHTTESAFDVIGTDTGAEGVARYQSTTDRPSSYHRIVDRDSTVVMLPDSATAFGVRGYNSRALSVSLAMRAADWGVPAKVRAAEPALQRLADVVAEWCREFDIPPRRITKAQADAGVRGITGHGVLDPGRRSDPGAGFPWARFLSLVGARLSPPKPPTPTRTVDVLLPVLRRGVTEPTVRRVQMILNGMWGEKLVTDGVFGPATEAALKRMQSKAKIPVTGVTDERTWRSLLHV